MRGLVQIDAVDGTVMGEYTEPNPEDWSKYGLDESVGRHPRPDDGAPHLSV